MASQIVLHCGAKPVTREALALVEPPPRSETWVPIKHLTFLETVCHFLGESGFAIEREQLGLTREGHRFFGTLDLKAELVPGVRLAVGIRSSTDQSYPLGFCAGSRVFVCDNLSFSSELIVKRKHSKNGIESFRNDIAVACSQNLTQFQTAERRRIEFMKRGGIMQPFEAEAFMLSAFERKLISPRVLPDVIDLYRKPGTYEWDCPPDSLWFLYNCFTTAIQKQAQTNPQRFTHTTMELMRMLGPKVGFDAPSDIELTPNQYEVVGEKLPDDLRMDD